MQELANEIQHRIHQQPLDSSVRQRSSEEVSSHAWQGDQLKDDRLSVFCPSVKSANGITNQ